MLYRHYQQSSGLHYPIRKLKIVKRILVDMSLTSLHHGHIRLLQKASLLGHVVVALCSDDEILKAKGFLPLLSFEHRKEIALAIRYVEEVIEEPHPA